MSLLLDTLLTPHQRDQALAADAAMFLLNDLRAERAVLRTTDAALGVSSIEAFESLRAATGPWLSATAKPARSIEDMQDQIREAQASLAAAEIALCAWYGQPDMSRARVLMGDAVAFLAEAL